MNGYYRMSNGHIARVKVGPRERLEGVDCNTGAVMSWAADGKRTDDLDLVRHITFYKGMRFTDEDGPDRIAEQCYSGWKTEKGHFIRSDYTYNILSIPPIQIVDGIAYCDGFPVIVEYLPDGRACVPAFDKTPITERGYKNRAGQSVSVYRVDGDSAFAVVYLPYGDLHVEYDLTGHLTKSTSREYDLVVD